MGSLIPLAIKFLVSLLVMTVVCTEVWDNVVNERLYDCTDAVGFDYLRPGDWVHGQIKTVPQVIHGRSMSEPDTILKGWTVRRLWLLWAVFVMTSVVLSAALAVMPWSRKANSHV